jgi:spermidine/putrescine transport system substrate-binding protein
MAELNLLAPLRHDWLSNLSHLDGAFAAPLWDPELRYSIPYMWGSTGIVVRKSVAPPPRAWAD